MRAVLIVLTLATRIATARPGNQPSVPATDEKSSLLAVTLPLGVTLASVIALVPPLLDEGGDPGELGYFALGGLFIGPSLGHAYADDWAWVGIGLGVRAAAFGMIMSGTHGEYYPEGCEPDFDSPCDQASGSRMLATGGLLLFVASTLVDIAHAPSSVRKYNREHRLSIAPTVTASGAGAMLGGSF